MTRIFLSPSPNTAWYKTRLRRSGEDPPSPQRVDAPAASGLPAARLDVYLAPELRTIHGGLAVYQTLGTHLNVPIEEKEAHALIARRYRPPPRISLVEWTGTSRDDLAEQDNILFEGNAMISVADLPAVDEVVGGDQPAGRFPLARDGLECYPPPLSPGRCRCDTQSCSRAGCRQRACVRNECTLLMAKRAASATETGARASPRRRGRGRCTTAARAAVRIRSASLYMKLEEPSGLVEVGSRQYNTMAPPKTTREGRRSTATSHPTG